MGLYSARFTLGYMPTTTCGVVAIRRPGFVQEVTYILQTIQLPSSRFTGSISPRSAVTVVFPLYRSYYLRFADFFAFSFHIIRATRSYCTIYKPRYRLQRLVYHVLAHATPYNHSFALHSLKCTSSRHQARHRPRPGRIPQSSSLRLSQSLSLQSWLSCHRCHRYVQLWTETLLPPKSTGLNLHNRPPLRRLDLRKHVTHR
jgi:hypothetical protein